MLPRTMTFPNATIGILVGLHAEARIARALGPVQIGGGLPPGARAATLRLIETGATALLSFGLAGGLDPNLPPGTLVIPAQILHHGQTYPADPALLSWLGGPTTPLLLATDTPIATATAKHTLFTHPGATAVDLESGELASIATAHRLPFAALRVICDPATATLPPAALAALDSSGAIGALRIAASLLRHPTQLPALLRLAADAAAAHATLRQHTASLP